MGCLCTGISIISGSLPSELVKKVWSESTEAEGGARMESWALFAGGPFYLYQTPLGSGTIGPREEVSVTTQ